MPASTAGWSSISRWASARAGSSQMVRRCTGRKAGHAGTLDPLATGVLPVAVGEATKTTAYAMAGRKRYRFRIRWGVARATDDREGEIVGESPSRPSREEIETVLPRFLGTIQQRPPAYSRDQDQWPPRLRARPQECAPAGLAPTARGNCRDPARRHAGPRPCRLRGAGGQGNLYPCARTRYRREALGTLAHVADTAPPVGRAFHGKSGDSAGFYCRVGSIFPRNPGICFRSRLALDDIPALVLTEAEPARLRSGQRVTPGRSANGPAIAGSTAARSSAPGTTRLWLRWPGSKTARCARSGSSIVEGTESMSITAERKQALITEYGAKEGDTGSARSPGGDTERAHPQPHRSLVDSQEGFPLAARPAGHGRSAASAVGLSEAIERGTLRDVDRPSRAAPLIRR